MGEVRAVRGVSFDVHPGECLGIVGESGSGKSALALSILQLLDDPGRTIAGHIMYDGKDILGMSQRELRELRGKHIAMIFPEPQSALNPVLKVGYQVAEAIVSHRRSRVATARKEAAALMAEVRIPESRARSGEYPHQFSGGMRQRVVIAMGLANQPAVLIADEPTTALDVTVQAQILDLLRELNSRHKMAIILVTHNMGVVAALCSRVLVMYAGRVVEDGPVGEIYNHPQHPYTWLLMRAMPTLDGDRKRPLQAIEGSPPDLVRDEPGCPFRVRCPFSVARCAADDPPLLEVGDNHRAACWVTMDRAQSGR
ncbi:MAG: ABC transporter ATP-binding protein [Terriglobia bacterium]